MTTDEIKTKVKHHRHAAVIGGVIGLALLLGYIAYTFAMTPARPDLPKAQPTEVIAYISNERGLPKLTQIEQQKFLERWGDLLREDAKRREDLRACLENLTDDQRKAFSEAMFTHFKRAFLDDARQYAHLKPEQQYDFLKKRIVDGRQQLLLLKEVTAGIKNPFAGNQDEFQNWLLQHTTPEERTIGEPYYNALKHVRPQVDKERSSPPAASQPTSRP
jgi:hypothetical protein